MDACKMLRSIIWTSLIYIEISQTSWIIGNESLPRRSYEMAVGEYNGTIFLIGGYGTRKVDPDDDGTGRQLAQFDIDTQHVTDLGNLFFSTHIHGGGQFWTQQAHIIYLLDPWPDTGSTFMTFNVITKNYTTDWQGTTLPINTGEGYPCLASSETFLYVVGGQNQSLFIENGALNAVQALSLITYSWISNTPPMQVARHSHACLVHNNYLWVFGGDSYRNKIAVNERIHVNTESAWQFIDSFTVGLSAIRAASWYDVIYIIGGWADDDENKASVLYDWVHEVSATTGSITISPDRLPYPSVWGSPIVVDGVFYVFGGYWDSRGYFSREWFYYTLPPFVGSTTQTPSNHPTPIATAIPSKNPSNQPSAVTMAPTAIPSNDPSNQLNPTAVPSKDPSSQPSAVTMNPTAIPSKDPSNLPSTVAINPTAIPSNDPSNQPATVTMNPTSAPASDPNHAIDNASPAPITNPTSLSTLNPTVDPVTSPSNKPTKERDERVFEMHASSMTPVSNTSHESDNGSLMVAVVSTATVSVSLLIFVVVIYYFTRKKKMMKEEQAIKVSMSTEVDNVETQPQTQPQNKTGERYNTHDVQTNDYQLTHQMNHPMNDNDKIEEMVKVDGKVTAGEAREGLDVVMADDEFEVVDDDERNQDNATEGGQTTVAR